MTCVARSSEMINASETSIGFDAVGSVIKEPSTKHKIVRQRWLEPRATNTAADRAAVRCEDAFVLRSIENI